MAYSMLSSATVVSSPAQAAMVAPFTGLKSSAAFPVTRKTDTDITSMASNGGRVNSCGNLSTCMLGTYTQDFNKFHTFPQTAIGVGAP
nr:Rubisco small subunit transit peptide/calcitonin fusion protein [synthetic construct]